MDYKCTKKYGILIRNIASLLCESDDSYYVARNLPCSVAEYYIDSRLAFTELYSNISQSLDIVKKVIDKFILNENVSRTFNNHPIFKEDLEFDFICQDLGDEYGLLQNIRIDLIALSALAHPDDYEKEFVQTAINEVICYRIQNTEEHIAAFRASLKIVENKLKTQQAQYQPTNKNEITDKNTQLKYTIGNNNLLIAIFEYIRESNVIPEDASLQRFMEMAEKADASNFKFLVKWKFINALYNVKECIKGNKRTWARDISSSLGIKPKELSKDGTNNGEWYEKLRKLVAKHAK